MSGRISRKFLGAVLLLALCLGMLGGSVSAADDTSGSRDISISAETVSQEDSDTYDIQVEIYNGGKDLSGTVRVMVMDSGDSQCAYDTPISLAEKSTKTCTVQIPEQSITDLRSPVKVALISQSGEILKEETFTKLFQSNDFVMPVGVLSDSYTKLTYLDLGGDEIFLMTDDYNIGLTKLGKDTLLQELDRIRYLVIDDFDTSTLDVSQIDAIQTWVRNGGMLIIGTGAAGDKTFSGFEEDFIEAELKPAGNHDQISQYPEEEPDTATAGDAADSNDGNSSGDDKQAFLYKDIIDYCDSPIDMASLDFGYNYSNLYNVYGMAKPEGDGSILVTNFSLSDDEIVNSKGASDLAYGLFTEVTEQSNYVLNNGGDYIYSYMAQQAFSIMEGNMSMNMEGMKVIVIIYVVLIGPVVYLVLKALKKREYCWFIIPAISLIFIGIVYIAGRGNQINGATAYSVTVSKADGTGKAKSYFSCYQAKPKEWELSLNDTVMYAGPVFNDVYYYGSSSSVSRYNNRIVRTPEGISAGYVPNGSFDTAYFMACSENKESGGIDYKFDLSDIHNPRGTVTNNSGHDFRYMLLLDKEEYIILSDVKNGETVDLTQAHIENASYLSDPDEIMYQFCDDAYDSGDYEKAQAGAALYMGLCEVYEMDMTLVMGVTEDYTNVIRDGCNETSWGCLYETGIK